MPGCASGMWPCFSPCPSSMPRTYEVPDRPKGCGKGNILHGRVSRNASKYRREKIKKTTPTWLKKANSLECLKIVQPLYEVTLCTLAVNIKQPKKEYCRHPSNNRKVLLFCAFSTPQNDDKSRTKSVPSIRRKKERHELKFITLTACALLAWEMK